MAYPVYSSCVFWTSVFLQVYDTDYSYFEMNFHPKQICNQITFKFFELKFARVESEGRLYGHE